MPIIQIPYANSIPAILNQSHEEFERDARMALAVKLFEAGRLTSGQAAVLAKIPRVRFLLECSHWGVASVIWDEEEIAAEFADFDASDHP
jgi:predicted HTH domain antitoxin